MLNKQHRMRDGMYSEYNYSEVVHRLEPKYNLRDNHLNRYYSGQTRYAVKASSNNNKNTVHAYQQKKEKDTFANVKNNTPFSKLTSQTRILIAESDIEVLLLFKKYLDFVGAESVTADDGDKALNIFQEDKNAGKNYDVVVLDTHLKGILGLDVAKKIYASSPNQRIVLLTTTLKEELSEDALSSAAIEDKDILVMPFRLSQLRRLLS
jgi:CheY-like chemotaxis protein